MTLKELLAAAEYTSLSDAEAASLANEKRHSITKDTWGTYRFLAGKNGVGMESTRRLILAMNAYSSGDVLIDEIRHSLRTGEGVNANDPATQGMLDQFAADAQLDFSTTDAAAIKALAESTESDVERYGLGEVRPGDVQVTRANM